MDPRRLSLELRRGQSDDLDRRRWVVGLSLFGSLMGGIVSLYQMGIVRRLPDLPIHPFDATAVDKAPYAYKRMRTPDGLLMLASYAVTAILAGAGGQNRARETPWIPVLAAAKGIYDVATTLRLSREEWQDTRRLCGYCTAGALASLATAALTVPEAWRALTGRT